MLYVVQIRRERGEFSAIMAGIREWLDGHRFEPDAFRCTTDEENVTCRLEFKDESEAKSCADAFRGEVTAIGPKPAE
jgi:hypothetical protein